MNASNIAARNGNGTAANGSASSAGRKTALRDKLLPGTIEHAREISHYRETWSGAEDGLVGVAGLPALPVLTRHDLQHRTEAMLHPERSADVLLHSTGTTTGRPVRRYRSADEINAFNEFRVGLSRRAQQLQGGAARPIVHFTTLSARHHGGTLGGTGGAQRTISLSVLTSGEVERSVGLLRAPALYPDLADCEYELSGPPDDLMLLAATVAVGGPLEPDRIRRVTSVADYLSERQSEFIRHTLAPGGRMIHRYSMSEVIGGATLCRECGLFHFDAHVVPEVVSLDEGLPVRAGVGRLVLTELYPFSQCQPLIRYDTGDLVEARESACDPGELSVALIGRRALTPVIGSGAQASVAYRPYPLREALEGIPEVSRAPLASRIDQWREAAGAAPLAACEVTDATGAEPARLTVRVAVGFPPALLPEAARDTVRRVEAAVLASSPETRALQAQSRLTLSVELTANRSAVRAFAVR